MPSLVQALTSYRHIIFEHPLGRRNKWKTVGRIASWQIGSRVLGEAAVLDFVEGTRMVVRPGMVGLTVNYYAGLYEFEEMGFVLHTLREDDLFVDVGANAGSFTVLAGGVASARCVSIEPVPATFGALRTNVALNHLQGRVELHNVGMGAENGRLRFSTEDDAMNRVVQGVHPGEPSVEVAVRTLDGLLDGRTPTCLKIDVEGWETKVLEGAPQLLGQAHPLAIVIEMNGSGSAYGFSDASVDQLLRAHGLVPCSYDPLSRLLTPEPDTFGDNRIYVRERAFFQARLADARAFHIHGTAV